MCRIQTYKEQKLYSQTLWRCDMVKYKGKRIIIKHVEYGFRFYFTVIKGVLIIYLDKEMSVGEKSKYLHKAIRTWS